MNYIFDLVMLVIFLVTVFIFYKRGFMKSIVGVVAMIAAAIVAKIFGPTVSSLFSESVLGSITKAVNTTLNKIVENVGTVETPKFDFSELFSKLPEEFMTLIKNSGADLDALSEKFSSMTSATEVDLAALSEKIAVPLANTIASVTGFLVVFFVALIVFSIAGFLLCKLVELPVLKTVDGILGAAIGVISGVIIIWIVCLIFAVVIDKQLLGAPSEAVQAIADSSIFIKVFGRLNPLSFITFK